MCGRYTLIRLADFTDMFPWIRPPAADPPARFNIAPTQDVAVVANTPAPAVEFFRWGLVPSWAKDPSIGSRMINARAESIAEKPAYRAALKRRRCLVPTSGFYEWRASPGGKGKTPMFIRMKDGKPFAFAGLWEVWHDPGGSTLKTCTVITSTPNEMVAEIHDRMAVILKPEDYKRWIKPGEVEPDELLDLLNPYPAGLMEAFPVSRAVNSPANEGAELVRPALLSESSSVTPTPGKGKGRRRGGDAGTDQPTLF